MQILKNQTIIIIAGILTVVFFDALQQKYYLDSFQIYPDVEITFWDLFISHSIRWSIWVVFCFIYGSLAWKIFKNNRSEIKFETWVLIIAFTLVVNMAAIFSISVLNLFLFGDGFNMPLLGEQLLFILYQKGMSFMFASGLVLLLLYNNAGNLVIDAQLIEIDALKSNSDQDPPTLTVKIGKKIKVIQLSNVHWIEAFDYCVKVHTNEKTYTMRNTLKSLQENLQPYNFIRVHRSALINLDYIDHIDFDLYLIKMLSKEEISLSKSGAKELKSALASKSV